MIDEVSFVSSMLIIKFLLSLLMVQRLQRIMENIASGTGDV